MNTQRLTHAIHEAIQTYQYSEGYKEWSTPYQSLTIEECKKEINMVVNDLKNELEKAEREMFDDFFKNKQEPNIGLFTVLENFQKTRQVTQRRVFENYSQHPNPRMAFIAKAIITGDYDLIPLFFCDDHQ